MTNWLEEARSKLRAARGLASDARPGRTTGTDALCMFASPTIHGSRHRSLEICSVTSGRMAFQMSLPVWNRFSETTTNRSEVAAVGDRAGVTDSHRRRARSSEAYQERGIDRGDDAARNPFRTTEDLLRGVLRTAVLQPNFAATSDQTLPSRRAIRWAESGT
jgi:hypothetical protein